MKKVWEFFENLDEYVYVTDVKTNELIYMNRKTMENLWISFIRTDQRKEMLSGTTEFIHAM